MRRTMPVAIVPVIFFANLAEKYKTPRPRMNEVSLPTKMLDPKSNCGIPYILGKKRRLKVGKIEVRNVAFIYQLACIQVPTFVLVEVAIGNEIESFKDIESYEEYQYAARE